MINKFKSKNIMIKKSLQLLLNYSYKSNWIDNFDLLEKNNKFVENVSVSKNGDIIYSKSIGFC